MTGLLYWAFHVVIATAILLLLSWLLWVVFNWLMGIAHGPELTYFEVAVIVAIVAIAVGNWGFSLLKRQAPASA